MDMNQSQLQYKTAKKRHFPEGNCLVAVLFF